MASYEVDIRVLVALMEGTVPLRHIVGEETRVPVDRVVTTETRLRELLSQYVSGTDIIEIIAELREDGKK